MNLQDGTQALLAKPSVPGLVYALRHPEIWPPDFVWNYFRADCCAMGLAERLWPSILGEDVVWVLVRAHPERTLPYLDCLDIFVLGRMLLVKPGREVTPKVIAEALETLFDRPRQSSIWLRFWRVLSGR